MFVTDLCLVLKTYTAANCTARSIVMNTKGAHGSMAWQNPGPPLPTHAGHDGAAAYRELRSERGGWQRQRTTKCRAMDAQTGVALIIEKLGDYVH